MNLLKMYTDNLLIWTSIIGQLSLVYSQPEPGYTHFCQNGDSINIDSTKLQRENYFIKLVIIGEATTPLLLTNTGNSIKATGNPPFPLNIMFGGPLGRDVYRFTELNYHWTDDPNDVAGIRINGKGTPLQTNVYFKNIRYTLDDSFKHPNGLVRLIFNSPICSDQNKTSLLFIPFLSATKEIQNPGSKTLINLGISISSVNAILPGFTYYTYPGSCTDIKGCSYNCVTNIVIEINEVNCISLKQFNDFVSLVKKSNIQSSNFTSTPSYQIPKIKMDKYIIQVVIP